MDELRILLVGSSGREHAFAWCLSKSPSVEKIFCAPGNGDTATVGPKVENCVPSIDPLDFPALVKFAKARKVNFVVPCSDAPLVSGIEGWFRAEGIKVFGPSKEAARLEGSKSWAKSFMTRHRIPTARHRTFAESEEAIRYIRSDVTGPTVVKASGLAAGKGVILATTPAEAIKAVHEIMVRRDFGDAGDEIVIEEMLQGDEISITLITDGHSLKLFPAGQDAQRAYDGNLGPNTGGMGVYAPTPLLNSTQVEEVTRTILDPTIQGMRNEGHPFVGFICIGLMLTATGPKLIEYNARFGDPEAQTLLPMLEENSDLANVLVNCTNQALHRTDLRFKDKSAVSVVMASQGYPGSYRTGELITIGDLPSGTQSEGGSLKTSGGRVLSVVALSNSLQEAVSQAYRGVRNVHFEGKHFRRDIGKW